MSTILVTGSSGHLGEALMRVLPQHAHRAFGIDLNAGPRTEAVGSIADRAFVRSCMRGVDVVLHTATLHKPHVATHTRQQFVDTNITGTLNLLEEAVAAGVRSFVFTSTTSVFGRAVVPNGGRAAWITEDVTPLPTNVYGITKLAAEHCCELFHRKFRLPCLILRTSRFFLDPDDNPVVRAAFDDRNLKVNELLYRRVDLADVVTAHLAALERASTVAFGQYIVSATTTFSDTDVNELAENAPAVVERYVPEYREIYARLGWSMPRRIDRVYVNTRARADLGWRPRFDFRHALERLAKGQDHGSELARAVGAKGYHREPFPDGLYPVDN